MRSQTSLVSIVAIVFFAFASTAQAEDSAADASLFLELSTTVQEVLTEKVTLVLADAMAVTVDSSKIALLSVSPGIVDVLED